jgi:hypothetical protein
MSIIANTIKNFEGKESNVKILTSTDVFSSKQLSQYVVHLMYSAEVKIPPH